MTVPNIFTGGTLAIASEVNANFAFNHIHRKKFTDATQRSTASTTFVDSGTSFTLSTPDNAMILGVRFKVDMQSGGAERVAVNLEFSGSTLADTYLIGGLFRRNAIDSGASSINQFLPAISTSEEFFFEGDTSGGFVTFEAVVPIWVLLTDTSTTITVRLRNSGAAGTVEMENVEVDVIYVEGFTED